MGQVNSTQASSSQPVADPLPPTPAASSSSSSASLPSVDDMRNLTNRILAATNDALKNLRENMPSLELPTVLSTSSPTSSDTPFSEGLDTASAAQEMTAVNAANMTDGLGFSTDPTPTLVQAGADQPLLVYRSFGDRSQGREASVTDLIKIHYQLSVDWVKNNAMTVTLAAVGLGTVLIVGTVAVRAVQAHRREKRRLRVLRGQDGRVKREVVVITHLGTLEGASLALSLEYDGFIVFGGVADEAKVAEIEQWGRADIHAVVVDETKTNPVEDLVNAVSSFLDQSNSGLLGGSPVSSSSSVVYEEELSSSTANIRLVSPEHALKSVSEAEAKRRHHGKTDPPLYRLAAVIVNPHQSVVGSIERVDLELWKQSIDTNITGTVLASQKFMPLLRRTLALAKPRRSPRLVILSSAITGSIGFPYQSSICASHHAVEAIADSLRREIKHQGIDVICLRVGTTERSYRKEWNEKTNKNAGALGLLKSVDPTKLLKETFKKASTTGALCDATYDAITEKKPKAMVRIGSGSLSYAFVGWAVPRSIVDWSIKRSPPKVYSNAALKVSTTSSTNAHEE
ncbi:hypothetical protein EMPS_10175 [Entomortierella parvispora]|uniref:Uncharacterized protein n=1 Tax=Entomortierella parvispora TaxID=205924 RepID=A0A9P3M0R8_9FUNG|nr:hypothetical protein EMPS_10175 [Entomortierella parvispora]